VAELISTTFKGKIVDSIVKHITRVVISVEALDGEGYHDLVGSDVKFDELWIGQQLKDLQNQHLCGNKNKISPCSDCTMNDYSEPDNLDSLMNKMEIK